jgi:hypothetical protein
METANNWTPGTHGNGKPSQQNQHYANKSDTNIAGGNRMNGANGYSRTNNANMEAKKKRKNSDKVSKTHSNLIVL